MIVRRFQAIAAAALVLAGAATGCSKASSSADVVSESTVEQPASTSAAQVPAPTTGEPAPTDAAPVTQAPGATVPAALDFRAPLVGGGEFDGAAYAGRPVAFWFWAPT